MAVGANRTMIPTFLLNRLYTIGRLRNTRHGSQFALKNRLSDAELVGIASITIDGQPVALEGVRFGLEDGRVLASVQVNAANPKPFPLGSTVTVQTGMGELPRTEIEIAFEAHPFDKLKLKVENEISEEVRGLSRIPPDEADNYNPEVIRRRRAPVEEVTGVELKHVIHHSFDLHLTKDNCENVIGVAQVPIWPGEISLDAAISSSDWVSAHEAHGRNR
jgi:hydroxymethylglutaryl-CoA reductase (NADPH)